jgi:hypothetical protein
MLVSKIKPCTSKIARGRATYLRVICERLIITVTNLATSFPTRITQPNAAIILEQTLVNCIANKQ